MAVVKLRHKTGRYTTTIDEQLYIEGLEKGLFSSFEKVSDPSAPTPVEIPAEVKKALKGKKSKSKE